MAHIRKVQKQPHRAMNPQSRPWETTSQTRTESPRVMTSELPGAPASGLPLGPHRHFLPSLKVSHPAVSLSCMAAVCRGWVPPTHGICCRQQQSGMGPWNSRATHSDHRPQTGHWEEARPRTAHDLSLPETGTTRAFRDANLDGKVVTMATSSPHCHPEQPWKTSLLP